MGDEEGVAASFLDGRPGAWWRRHIKARGAGRFFSVSLGFPALFWRAGEWEGHERLRVPHPWLDQEKNHFFCMCLVIFSTDRAYIYASCLKSWLEGGAFCGTGVRGLAQREYIAQPYGVSLAGRWS